MPRNFLRKSYDEWIGNNHHKFRYRPRIVESRQHQFVIQFDGLSKQIELRLSRYGMAEILVTSCQLGMRDIIAEFDVFEGRTAHKTYYCRQCLSTTYYPSRVELWRAHVFQPMRLWVNKIGAGSMIYFWGEESQWCEGKLVNDPGAKVWGDYVCCFSALAGES